MKAMGNRQHETMTARQEPIPRTQEQHQNMLTALASCNVPFVTKEENTIEAKAVMCCYYLLTLAQYC